MIITATGGLAIISDGMGNHAIHHDISLYAVYHATRRQGGVFARAYTAGGVLFADQDGLLPGVTFDAQGVTIDPDTYQAR